MICPSREKLAQFVKGELGAKARNRCCEHIHECTACDALVDDLRRAQGELVCLNDVQYDPYDGYRSGFGDPVLVQPIWEEQYDRRYAGQRFRGE